MFKDKGVSSKEDVVKRIRQQSFITAEELLLRDDDGDCLGANEDLMDRLLASDDQAQLKEILKYLREIGCSESDIERVELESYYAKLRRETNLEMDKMLKARDFDKSPKSEFEEMAGVLMEEIEPQVRKAVLDLNAKGYKTLGSGFYGNSSQQIYLSRGSDTTEMDQSFADYCPSEELKEWLREKNVELEVEPDSITYTSKDRLDLVEMENIWNRIVADVPHRE